MHAKSYSDQAVERSRSPSNITLPLVSKALVRSMPSRHHAYPVSRPQVRQVPSVFTRWVLFLALDGTQRVEQKMASARISTKLAGRVSYMQHQSGTISLQCLCFLGVSHCRCSLWSDPTQCNGTYEAHSNVATTFAKLSFVRESRKGLFRLSGHVGVSGCMAALMVSYPEPGERPSARSHTSVRRQHIRKRVFIPLY